MLINLTRVDRKEFYIATAHKGNIFNYETNSMRYVHGHVRKNIINEKIISFNFFKI